MDNELLNWELLHGSDTESTDSNKKSGSSSVIDDVMILSDHFSADNLINKPTDLSQYGVIESGDFSRVDYGSDRRQNQADIGFDQFNVDTCVSNELGFYDSKTGVRGDGEVRLSDFEAADVENKDAAELTGGTLSQYEDSSKCFSESDALEVADGRNVERQSGVEEPIDDSSKSWSDSGGNILVSGDSGIVNGGEEIVTDSGVVSTVEVEAVDSAVRSGDEGKSREIVWWKMPIVLLKYSVFRIGPVWSVSMAAAVMGLALLGRRLYNMKKKAQRFHLKVTIDDKKVSPVMSQAARLNEVFTEVRRVPVIRPALPSPGAWPVLSLR